MKIFLVNFFRDRQSAQSAAELAIFGAMLVFVIGLILRAGLASSQSMNAQLKALRLALSESYRTAEGYYHRDSTPGRWKPSGARNFASFLLVEDRISVDAAGRFSSMDRIPFTAVAGGTFSRNLMYPMEYAENDQIPLTDVIINGQRFPFSRAAFSEDILAHSDGSRWPAIPECDPGLGSPSGQGPRCWAETCYTDGGGNPQGCTIMYRIVGNYKASKEWCDGSTIPCTENMDANHRFNLDLDQIANGTDPDDVNDPPLSPDQPTRPEFTWQWVMVAGVSAGTTPDLLPAFFAPWLSGGVEGIRYCKPGERDCEPINPELDTDGDFKEENVFGTELDTGGGGSTIVRIRTFDGQRGDVDLTWDDRDNKMLAARGLRSPISFGLQPDIEMFSFTQDGTWLRVHEGQLLTISTAQFVRTIARKEHVDVVQRMFRLRNDTGRFCDASGNPTDWSTMPGLSNPNKNASFRNPVEACNNCFSSSNNNIQKTCMDQGAAVLFVRSRIQDLRGRKWITRVGPP